MNNDKFLNDPSLLDVESAVVSKSFISSVFSWMFAGLLISGVTSWLFANSGLFTSIYLNGESSILRYVIMFAPLGFVFLIGGAYNRLSSAVLSLLFVLFSVLMGMSFAYIFHVFEMGSIINIFFTSAGLFGFMAFLGYTTSADLTKLGTILYIGLIAGIVLSLINYFFIGSGPMDILFSVILLIVFVGLTAYDMQKVKKMAMIAEEGQESTKKMAIMAALSLYLDFINIFLLLLRLFGNRN